MEGKSATVLEVAFREGKTVLSLDIEDSAFPMEFCFFCGAIIHPIRAQRIWVGVDESMWLVSIHDFCKP